MWPSFLDIAIKLALGLLALVLVINLTGKGDMAPTSATDQVHNYVLGGIIGGVIYDGDVSVMHFLYCLLVWIVLVLALKWLKRNSNIFKRAVDGEPAILISGGEIDVAAVRRVGMSAHDLAFKLRAEGVYAVREVKQALLEQDGRLLITLRGEENPKYPLVADGLIQHATLTMIDQDEDWLRAELRAQGHGDVATVFLAEYESGRVRIVGY